MFGLSTVDVNEATRHKAKASLSIICHSGADLRCGKGHVPPDSLFAPQIRKLADRSDVILEVPKCSKMPPRTPLRELTSYSASQTPQLTGRELAASLPRTPSLL